MHEDALLGMPAQDVPSLGPCEKCAWSRLISRGQQTQQQCKEWWRSNLEHTLAL